jgi:predicted RNA-binding Zn-ribbon protein involved in translation (DUF1610 family)
MAERKILRLTCPVCENKLKVAEGINRFACLNCGTELNVIKEGEVARVEPIANAAGGPTLTSEQRELIQVNSEIRAKDESYGVGCAVATLGITAVACVSVLIASALKLTILFGITIFVALLLLAVVVLLFMTASSRETQPLLRRRDALQDQINQNQSDNNPNPQGSNAS